MFAFRKKLSSQGITWEQLALQFVIVLLGVYRNLVSMSDWYSGVLLAETIERLDIVKRGVESYLGQ